MIDVQRIKGLLAEVNTLLSEDEVAETPELDFDALLRQHLVFEENCNIEVHDVDGKPHVGYGRCLVTKGLTDEELDKLGYEDEDDIHEITQEQADYLFDNDIAEFTASAIEVCGEYWTTLNEVRRVVCVSLCYNVGKEGFHKFRRMHLACGNGDWETASKEILDSKAFKFGLPGVKARYQRLSNAMKSGTVDALEMS